MAYVYFPSCKFMEFAPQTGERVTNYMREHFDAVVAGCCRPEHHKLTVDDIAVTICNTCQAIVAEDSPARVMSVWELVAADSGFSLPDAHGERMALQDCWRSRGCAGQQDAVRTVLHRMNVDVVELDDARDASTFCGTTLLAPLPPENARFAPRQLGAHTPGLYMSCSPDEQRRLMEERCADIPVERVVCYCVPCTKGIRLGGKSAIHLAELVFCAEE